MSNRKYPFLLALLFILSCRTGSAQPTTTVSPRRTVLYRPGDFDSQFFRIPALITAKDGSLVAACDRRKYSNADLPEDIDIILNRSTDGGQSWSGPQFLAIGRGKGQGFGDCTLAHTRDEGKSWSIGRVIVPYNSAYSSLCLLPDSTIGTYVEEDPKGGDHYEMVFYNFNLEWLEEHLKP